MNGRVNLRILQPGPTDNLDLFRIGADGSQEKLPIHYPYCRADEVYLIRLQRNQTSPVEISLSLDPAPPNDDLAGALPLPFVPTPYDLSLAGSEPGESLHWSIWWHFTPPVDGALIASDAPEFAGRLEFATTEPLEPPHRQYAAEHSAWLQWTAPDATPVADGIGGVEFIPVRGETYHIAIDVARGAAAGPVTIRLTQPLTGYAAWRAARFPDPNAPDADPHADPDGDGRSNLMEMALGTNPLAPDAAPGKLRIRDVAGHLTLSIDRPMGVDGIRDSFEVAPALGEPWLDAKSMAHLEWATPLEDGMEIDHTLLIPMKTKDHPTLFARLRVEPADQ